jgi:hypothetical protein
VYLRAEMVFNQGLRGGYILKRRLGDGLQVMLLSDTGFVPLANVLVKAFHFIIYCRESISSALA